jgi:hypothetical protein
MPEPTCRREGFGVAPALGAPAVEIPQILRRRLAGRHMHQPSRRLALHHVATALPPFVTSHVLEITIKRHARLPPLAEQGSFYSRRFNMGESESPAG